MTTAQKVIKYLAMAFAIFLIFTIISAILGGVYVLVNAFDLINGKDRPVLTKDYSIISEIKDDIIKEYNPKVIDIELSATELQIKIADKFKVETNNTEIKYKETNGKIEIVENEEHKLWFIGKDFDSKLIIYLPQNEEMYEEVIIKAGAGKISIDKLETKKFKLEQGAGKVEIENLVVSEEARLEGGAGEISIKSGKIKNLRLDQGLGKTYIKANLLGKTDIESGIGALELNLNLPKEAYKFNIKKGIGKVTVNDVKVGSDLIFGEGENYIKIEGGIGSIQIKTNQE